MSGHELLAGREGRGAQAVGEPTGARVTTAEPEMLLDLTMRGPAGAMTAWLNQLSIHAVELGLKAEHCRIIDGRSGVSFSTIAPPARGAE